MVSVSLRTLKPSHWWHFRQSCGGGTMQPRVCPVPPKIPPRRLCCHQLCDRRRVSSGLCACISSPGNGSTAHAHQRETAEWADESMGRATWGKSWPISGLCFCLKIQKLTGRSGCKGREGRRRHSCPNSGAKGGWGLAGSHISSRYNCRLDGFYGVHGENECTDQLRPTTS